MKRFSKAGKILIIIVVIIAAACGAFGIYLGDYYHALPYEENCNIDTAINDPHNFTVYEKNDSIIFEAEDPVAGFVFYPGGKVEYTSYRPLMEKLACRGITCVLLHVTGNLAILEMNAADKMTELFPDLDWYIGGHSLGGVAASDYACRHSDLYKGVVLMAAYSTKDLKDTPLRVLCIYGSQDGVMQQDKYEQNKNNLPDDFKEIVINGGVHALFGNYGEQKGDGGALISADEQQNITADAILEMVTSSPD